MVPAANGINLVVPSRHLDSKYLCTVVQWQNSATPKTQYFLMYCTQGLKRTQLYKTQLFLEAMQLQQFGHMNSDQFYS